MESVKWNDDDGMCNVNGWSSQNPFITVMLVKVAWFQELVFILEKCTSEKSHFLKIVLHRICGPADLWICGPADLRICGPADLRSCGSADLRICGAADLRTCGPEFLKILEVIF